MKESIRKIREALFAADAIVIGAGSGLSAAAGFTYSGERFDRYFADFRDKFGIRDMYSGGFYPFPDMETFWAWWSRHIWINRYAPIPNDVYDRLFELVKNQNYFVLTTNVDHCFQRTGFDKDRLFYTQGDYGVFQSVEPKGASVGKTYDNREIVREMLLSQGFIFGEQDELIPPVDAAPSMRIPTKLIPICPDDGKPMTTNLRIDDSFVEDGGWHKAAERYSAFLEKNRSRKIVYLELGVGMNTPVIIKYPFWKMTAQNSDARYICINKGEATVPKEIAEQSICLDADIQQIISDI